MENLKCIHWHSIGRDFQDVNDEPPLFAESTPTKLNVPTDKYYGSQVRRNEWMHDLLIQWLITYQVKRLIITRLNNITSVVKKDFLDIGWDLKAHYSPTPPQYYNL